MRRILHGQVAPGRALAARPGPARSLALAAGVAAGLILGLPAIAAADPPSRWIHVKVEQTSPERETVRVNLPVRLVCEMIPAIQNAHLAGGHVLLDSMDVRDVDLRRAVEALRGAEDGEYVTVQGEDEDVKIMKRGGLLTIDVHGKGEKAEDVHMKMRMDVLAALISGPPGQLDIAAAVEALGAEEAELITVNEKDETVRIWVDSRPSAD